MLRVVLAVLVTTACGRAQGVADEDLGALVVAPKQVETKIDVARAATEPAELGRALTTPYRKLVAGLGPHVVSIAGTTIVDEAGEAVMELSERTTLELGAGDVFRGVYTNTQDYGREVTFVDGSLYLRPRYQRWHKRAPETTDEPLALRDAFVLPIAAVWDLLAPGVELTDQGAIDVAGRSGRKIAVQQSPRPAKPPAEALVQRKWREQRTIEDVTGEVVIDTETGAPLTTKLSGTVGFMRDGRRFRMKLSVTSAISDLGKPAAITAPAPEEVVTTPERLREVDERDYLLQGIAPPLRKNPDGTAVTPTLPKAEDK